MADAETGNTMITIERDELSALTSFDDAVAFLASKGYEVGEAADLLGDGFTSIEKKDLVNVPLVLLDATITDSKDHIGSQFAVIRAITATDMRVRFSDGSTGIKEQVLSLLAKRPGGVRGVLVPRGLTSSEYFFCPNCESALSEGKCEEHPKAKISKGETFYFAV
jgi:hypothetical protein